MKIFKGCKVLAVYIVIILLSNNVLFVSIYNILGVISAQSIGDFYVTHLDNYHQP